jgi:hypothetical protein
VKPTSPRGRFLFAQNRDSKQPQEERWGVVTSVAALTQEPKLWTRRSLHEIHIAGVLLLALALPLSLTPYAGADPPTSATRVGAVSTTSASLAEEMTATPLFRAISAG